MEKKVEKIEKVESGKKKMSKKTKGIIIAVVLIVLAIAVGVAVLIGYHAGQLVLLEQETNQVLDSIYQAQEKGINDSTTINMEIKTTGGYAVIEKEFKSYMNQMLDIAKNINNLYNEETITQMVSIENLKSDGPEFTNTKEQIETMKTKTQEYFDEYIALSNLDKIMGAVDDKPISDYYKTLYKGFTTENKQEQAELDQLAKELESSKTEAIESLDGLKQIFTFLSENKSAWKIEGEQILFYNQSKLNEYRNMINKLTI